MVEAAYSFLEPSCLVAVFLISVLCSAFSTEFVSLYHFQTSEECSIPCMLVVELAAQVGTFILDAPSLTIVKISLPAWLLSILLPFVVFRMSFIFVM